MKKVNVSERGIYYFENLFKPMDIYQSFILYGGQYTTYEQPLAMVICIL